MVVDVQGKKIWRSRTFWWNILALVVALAGYFGFGDFEASPDTAAIAAGVAAVINLVLRVLTDEPVTIM